MNPQAPRRPPQASSGFTLVEMVIAAFILAIIAIIAIPAFQDMIVQSRLSAQTNDLVGAIQAARGEAIKRNRRIDFCGTSSATSTNCTGSADWDFWIVRINNTATVLRRGAINAELRLTTTLPAGVITFLPDGTAAIAVGNDTLTTCSPKGTGNTVRTITVGLAGRTSIAKTTGACS